MINRTWFIGLTVLFVGLPGCGLTDPGTPDGFSTFHPLSLPQCELSVLDVSDDSVRLQIVLNHTKTTPVDQLILCYGIASILPDTTGQILNITSLFDNEVVSATVSITLLRSSMEYACRIYIANQKESTYSDVIHFVTEPNKSIAMWEKVALVPFIENGARVVFKAADRIFLFSDYVDDTGVPHQLWEYLPLQQEWVFIGATPFIEIVEPVYWVIDNKFYTGMRDNKSDEKRQWWSYDPVQDKWTRKCDFIGPMALVVAYFSVGGKGYVVSTSAPLDGSKYPDAQVFEYDPDKDTWQMIGTFPGATVNHTTSVVLGDRAYVLGGDYFFKREYTTMDYVWEYDAKNNRWYEKDKFPGGARTEMLTIPMGNVFYAGFGRKEYLSYMYYYDWWVYSPKTNTWTSGPTSPNWASPNFTPRFAFEYMGDLYVGSGSSGLWKFTQKGGT